MQNAIEAPTILLLEDDPLTRSETEQALRCAGFGCEYVTSGEDALAAFLADPKRYNALVTEVALQGEMTGWQVARKIRETAPRLPVIYLSGPSSEQWRSHGVPRSLRLVKPFAPAQLVAGLSTLLSVR